MFKPDPIIGTWKLNVVRSRFSQVLLNAKNETVPKEATEVYKEVGDQIGLTVANTMINGEQISGKYIWPRQGGVARSQEDVPAFVGITIVQTLIAPGEWYATFLRDGKQFMVVHKMMSENRKTLNLTTTGTDTQGKTFEQTVVYDRQ